MQFAIVSDLHANLQAWNAVLLDIRSQGIDRIICLGDVVGYGPQPAEVLKSVHENVNHLVLGNHDAVVCGKMDPALFNDMAQEVIRWTREQLNSHAVRFLRSLPLTLNGGEFRCAHGDFSDPGAYNYVIDPPDAAPSWRAVPEPLLFVGHSHVPGIFLLGHSGTPRLVAPQDFELEEGKRFLVNVGAVGSPRDGDARASYCIFDIDRRSVTWRRIPFDLDLYREAVAAAGLPPQASPFLNRDPRLGKQPLRELLNFSPATTPAQAVQGAVLEQELVDLRHSVRRWQWLTAATAIAAAVLLAAAGALWLRHATRAMQIPGTGPATISATAADAEANLLPAPEAPRTFGEPISGWTVRLGDRRAQSVAVEAAADGGAAFVVQSARRADELRLMSPSVRVEPGMRLCVEALFQKGEPYDGTAAIFVSLTRETGGRAQVTDQFVVKEPSMARAGGWVLAKSSFAVPAGGISLQVQMRARFAGVLRVKDVRLVRKESPP
jgi:predicted phosphodiesterase